MTKVKQQILEVMRTIYNEWKLNPENKPFSLWVEKFSDQPDHKAILQKLAEQYKIIEIQRLPNEEGIEEHELGAFEDIRGTDELRELLSYTILVKPSFEAFYKEHFADNSVNVPSLNTRNFWVVIDTAEQIDDKINISLKNTVEITSNETGSYIYNGPFLSLSYAEIADLKQGALEFLKTQNAIDKFESITREETDLGQAYEVIDSFIVDVDRHVFQEVYSELKSLINKYSEKMDPNIKVHPIKHEIIFDMPNEKLVNGQKSVNVTSGTIEYFILKALYSIPIGQGADVDDIVEEWGGNDGKQTIYDAVTRLNKKFRSLLGTTNKDTRVVFQRSSRVYLDKEYSDSISTHE